MRRYLFAIIPFVLFLPVTVEAQTTTPLEDCLATLEPGEWTTCGGDPIPLVNTSELDHPALIGVFGPRGIIDSWSGAAYTDEYMIFHGGGHDQWGGNEVIAYNYEQLEWERWVDPSAVPDEMEVGADEFCHDPYPDGTPAARHTFNSLSYDPVNNQVLRFGGFPYGIDMSHICGGGTGSYPGGVSASAQVWSLDLDNLEDGWEPHGTRPTEIADDMGNWGFQMKTVRLPNGNILVRGSTGIAEYDPNTYEWVSSTTIGVAFNPQAGSYKKTPDGSRYIAVEGETMWWSDEPPTNQNAYAKNISQHDTLFAGQGFDYHPASGDVVVWGGGDTVYVWDMDEDTFDPITTVNPPLDGHGRVYSKFKYLDQHDVFIGYNNHNDAVRFYRHDPQQDTDPDPDPEPGVFITSFDEPEHTVGQVPSGWTEHGQTNGEWIVGEENGERYLRYWAGTGRYHRMITWDALDENYNFHVIGEFERMNDDPVEIMPMMRASYKFRHPNHPDRATLYRAGWESSPGRMRGYRHTDEPFGSNAWGSGVGAASVPDIEPNGTRWCIETRVDDDRVRTRRWEKGGSNAAGPECADGHANPSFWHTDSIDSAGQAENYFQDGKIRLAGSGGLATRDRNGRYRVYNMVWNVEETGTYARHWDVDYVPVAEKPLVADARWFADFEEGGFLENFELPTMTIEDNNGLGDLMYFDGRNSGLRPSNTDPYSSETTLHISDEPLNLSTCGLPSSRWIIGPLGDRSHPWAIGINSNDRNAYIPIIQANLEPWNDWDSGRRCDLDENNDPIDVRLNHQYNPGIHWYAYLYTGEQWYMDKLWESVIPAFTTRGLDAATGVLPIASRGPTPALNNQQRTQTHLYRDLVRLKATGMHERSPAFAEYYDKTMAALLKYGPQHDPNDSIRPSRKEQALDILPNWGSRPGIGGSGTTGANDDYSEYFMYYWQPITAAHAENLGLSADGWDEIHTWLMRGIILPWENREQGHTKFYPHKNWPLYIHDEPSLFCVSDSPLAGQYYANTPDPHTGDLDTYEKMIAVMEDCQSQQYVGRIDHDHEAEGNYFPINIPLDSWWRHLDQFFGILDGYAWIGSDQATKDTACEMIAGARMDWFEWYDEHTDWGPSHVNELLTTQYHLETTPDCTAGDGRESGYFYID